MFEKNLENLLNLNPRLKKEIDIEIKNARLIQAKYSDPGSETYETWTQSRNAILLPSYHARSQEDENKWKELAFRKHWSLKDYIDLAEEVHLAELIVRLRGSIRDSGFDPDVYQSPLASGINALIAFGTGNGQTLLKLIKRHKPNKLCIFVSSWSEFISSFDVCDWSDIWNSMIEFSGSNDAIHISRISDVEEPLAYIVNKLGLLVDHSYVYKADYISDELSEAVEKIYSRQAIYNIVYLGYTIDEYNMIINTTRTLKKNQARIYVKPRRPVGGNAIVCGSGPSLDALIPFISEAQNTSTIIASGSNYMTLLKNSIRVDYLVLVERADETLKDYQTTFKTYGLTDTTLVMSSTCNHQLIDLFKKTIVYFRPALTSTCVFSTSDSQILSGEGPESVNAGFAFACDQGFNSIMLTGVDLGTKDIAYDRSKDAVGVSEREWDIKAPGNLSETVFTNKLHEDCKNVIESRIRSAKDEIEFMNLSDGVLIQGASPTTNLKSLTTFLKDDEYSTSVNLQSEWLNSLIIMDVKSVNSLWKARNPRMSMKKLVDQLNTTLKADEAWFPDRVQNLEDLLNPLDKPIGDQIAIRILRSLVLKGILMISQQLQIMRQAQSHELLVKYLDLSTSVLCHMIAKIETEYYELCLFVEHNS